MSSKFLVGLLVLLMLVPSAFADVSNPIEKEGQEEIILNPGHLEKAIVHLLTKGFERHRIKPCPNHRLMKNPGLRRELVEAVFEAASKNGLDPMLLLVIAFREGSFKNDSKGALGEESTFQIMPIKKRACDLSTYIGAANCAAKLLKQNLERCKDIQGAFVLYATGRTCKADTSHLMWLKRDRFNLAKRLTEIVKAE